MSASQWRAVLRLIGAKGSANCIADRRVMLGVVLYDGELSLPFGEQMYAAPISCLWGK
jgi:hypothetical protein